MGGAAAGVFAAEVCGCEGLRVGKRVAEDVDFEFVGEAGPVCGEGGGGHDAG